MASPPFVLGGPGGDPDLNAILCVANGREVVLDKATADQIKRASPPPKSFKAEEGEAGSRASSASDNFCEQLGRFKVRAALLAQLLRLINGSSAVRLQVVEALVEALNSNTLSLQGHITDIAVQQQIADALAGKGRAELLSPPGISSNERLVLEYNQSSSTGIAAAVIAASKPALAAATAVAALTCEALQAQTKSFEEESRESQGNQSVASAASDLKGLLEGSGRVNDKKAGAGTLFCIASVPKVHGAAEAALLAASATARAEVATACMAPERLALYGPSLQLPEDVLQLARRLAAVAAQSVARSLAHPDTASGLPKDLRGMLQEKLSRLREMDNTVHGCLEAARTALSASEAWSQAPGLGAALTAADALHCLHVSIATEATLAVARLRAQEGPASGQPAPAPPAGDAGDKKKAKKKPAGAGFVLGRGTTVLRSALESSAGNAVAQLAQQMGQLSVNGAAAAANGKAKPLGEDDATDLEPFIAIKEVLDPCGHLLEPLLAQLSALIEATTARRKPKIAKGTRDFRPDQMTIRKHVFQVIENVFERHGAKAIDTPVFELKETLTNKYGEDSKLIYDLADQGGEMLSLRFDLTVPFARYLALNAVQTIKRYHIARVYRRDQPQAARGRFREFFQCDFDIAGNYAPMAADAEVLKVVVEILTELEVGDFAVKLSHRRLLDAMLALCGVPADKFRTICSAIDKLDKEPWAAVRAEMVEQKGLAPEAADRIQMFVEEAGEPEAMIAKLTAPDYPLAQHPEAAAALQDMKLLFQRLTDMGTPLHRFRFDLSLARGLHYYTGLIYEAVLVAGPDSGHENVGSIAAGGRYDGLVGQFSPKQIPSVGVSVGIERVFAVLEGKFRARAEQSSAGIRETRTQVLIASPGKGMLSQRCQLAAELWQANIPTEFGIEKENPNFKDQLDKADNEGIPLVVVLGEAELAKGVVLVKNMWRKKEGEGKGAEVQRSQIVPELDRLITEIGSRSALLTKQ
ncbi:hypothetical protein CVIRNUC_007659 [Coccomyxa viridis]|uniref:Histidine--tRNA ligase, cytoplasmic n=1 Tax=Coccomyxa viridis TaxID=1274662 RepID=A0AAV1IDY2_9CHLO|nr:hypothetical protein CVIRNUC_007659 [Coccomyxa viridis]